MTDTADRRPQLPKRPIDKVVRPIVRFMHVQAASGVVLLMCTLIALALANSSAAEAFLEFWRTQVGFTIGDYEFRHSLKHLVNDGLMAIFFFVIGLEVKREIVHGELSDLRRASLPIFAALGGMIAPALVYLFWISGSEGQRGWGIPMATDIAFVVGCMAVLGPRVPHSLRITMLSLAIADDIGAILVIAIGYTSELSTGWLCCGFAGIILVSMMARIGVRSLPVYTAAGVVIWFAFHESGVHATIAGVILGLMTPARSYVDIGLFGELLERATQVMEGEGFGSTADRGQKIREFRNITRETISPLEYLETTLHPWTGFVIMPIFALANAGVPLHVSELGSPVAIAVMLGLLIGKPLGILVFSWLAVNLKLASLPEGMTWGIMLAGGCLAGIGFTMALFIAGLALSDGLLDTAKIGVLAGSALSAILGCGLLLALLPRPAESNKTTDVSEERNQQVEEAVV